MKKTFIFTILAVLATFVSCNKSEIGSQAPAEGYRYEFAVNEESALAEDMTKATLDNSGVTWVAGDRVGMFLDGYTGYAEINLENTPRTVILYSPEIIPANSYAYAYYPNASNSDKTAVKIALSNVQQGGVDAAMPMVGVPFKVLEEAEAKSRPNGTINFLNLGSIICFKVYSSKADYLSETIQYISLEASDASIAGTASIDLTKVNAADASTLAFDITENGSNTVKVNQEATVASAKTDASSIYMVLAPGQFGGTITVGTEAATYTWTLPEMTFNRNGLKTFNMDLKNANRSGVVEVVKTLPYEEAFTVNQGDFSIENVTLPEGQTSIWSFDSSYGAKVTSYINKVNYASESWLVSPQIDLTDVTAAELSFNQCVNKYMAAGDGSLWIKVAGDDDFTQIPNTYPAVSGTWSSFEPFTFDLSDYIGEKVIFAFKYVSTSDSAGTWEIKDFSVTGKSATDPEIEAEDVTGIPVVGGSDFTLTYELVNFTDDDIAATVDGTVVTEATANNGTVTYSVAPNYTTSAKSGKITLSSASTGASKEITVVQLKSSGLKVSENTIVIPADATTATFTITTVDFGWNTEVTTLDGMNLSINPTSGSASEEAQTVTITSTTTAANEAQDIGSIVVYRNGNTSDTGKKTITVKKAAVAVAGLYTLDGTITASGNAYASASDVTQNGVSWKVTGNTEQSPWRIGGKSLSSIDRDVYSTTPISYNVGKIEITHGNASNITVNSMTIVVASDASFSKIVSTLSADFAANGTVTVNRPEGADWTNCYYKIVYNVSVAGSSNRFLEFSKAVFSGN